MIRRFASPVVLILLLALVGCAASTRETTIKAALVAVDASRAALVAYDAGKQTEIVAQATSLEDGKAKLATYRTARGKAETAFGVAYRAIAVAATLNDDQSVAALQKSVLDVLAVVALFTGGKP